MQPIHKVLLTLTAVAALAAAGAGIAAAVRPDPCVAWQTEATAARARLERATSQVGHDETLAAVAAVYRRRPAGCALEP